MTQHFSKITVLHCPTLDMEPDEALHAAMEAAEQWDLQTPTTINVNRDFGEGDTVHVACIPGDQPTFTIIPVSEE
ncbi:MAG: hypothetical protein F6J87_30055 [Spirulina sp. SIO3F2]|nr:hypothetical protein [Spirulina sp. SIO3F2]